MRAFDKEAIYYDIFHSSKDYSQEALKIKQMYPNAKTILEIGSGTGLMTVELEKLGFVVKGLEPCASMTTVAGHCNRLAKQGVYWSTIEDFSLNIAPNKYDLVLALYDVLNYLPFKQMPKVLKKIRKLGHDSIIELWPDAYVKPFTFKSVPKCKRVRFGFRFNKRVYLWYIFWGNGLVISFHKLF